ncbi:MAG: hypothetical protein HY822_24005 [Acidobacteria bacterium]|nr:hypothetical protein [Acidobacteriota bacterium]
MGVLTCRKSVVVVRAGPGEFAAGLNRQGDEGLHRNHGPDRPQRLARQRPVRADAHARTQFAVLDADFVVLGAVAETLQGGGHDIPVLQRLPVHDPVSANFGQLRVGRTPGLNPEWNGDRKARTGRLPVQHQEIVVVDAGPDGAGSGVFQTVFQHHLRLALSQPHGLPVDVTMARRRMDQFLSEHDGIASLPDGPLSRIGDLVQPVVVVPAFVRFSKGPHTDFDEGAARLGLLPRERSELVHRAGDRAARSGNNVRALVHEITNLRIGLVEPGSVVFVPLELQAVDDARPIEPGAAIIAGLRIRQVDTDPDLAVRDLGGTEIGRRQNSSAQAQGSQNQSLLDHR